MGQSFASLPAADQTLVEHSLTLLEAAQAREVFDKSPITGDAAKDALAALITEFPTAKIVLLQMMSQASKDALSADPELSHYAAHLRDQPENVRHFGEPLQAMLELGARAASPELDRGVVEAQLEGLQKKTAPRQRVDLFSRGDATRQTGW